MVDHSHVVRRQRIGAISGVTCERLENAYPGAGRGSATEFGGIEQLTFGSDSAAVKQPTFVEEVCSLEKEGTVFSELNFKRAEVEHKVVGDHLAKVRHQSHVDREGVANAHFGIHSTIDRRRPLTFLRFIHGGGGVGADVGEECDSRGRVNPFDAAKDPALIDHAPHGGVQGIPHRFLARATHRSPNVHAPNLFHTVRKAWHSKLAPRNPDFSGPSAFVDLAFHFPNAIPRII